MVCQFRSSVFICFVFTFCLNFFVNAEDPILPAAQAKPEIEALLKSLKPNTWVKLPPFKIEGKMSELAKKYKLDVEGPNKRNFCVKVVWAPERKRALFCGANHGVPHRLNDIWEYDLPSNTWFLLHAPDFNSSRTGTEFNDKVVLKDGFPMTAKTSAPTHVAHTWWQITYDPNIKAVIWVNSWPGTPLFAKKHDLNYDEFYKGPPLWKHEPQSQKWSPIISQSPYPDKVGMGWTLEYIPDLKASFYSKGNWLYYAKESKWEQLAVTYEFEGKPRIHEAVMAYDAKNKILVSHLGVHKGHRGFKDVDATKRTYHFDLTKKVWSEAKIGEENMPAGTDAFTPFYYDPASGHCLLIDTLAECQLWAYDASRNAWQEVKVEGETPPKGIAWIDPDRKVLVMKTKTEMFVLRYEPKN